MVAPTICTGDDLIPTDLESQQERGKVFSCSCGAGDSYTGALCSLQPDTWVEFTIKGPGTDADPAVMTFTGDADPSCGGGKMFFFFLRNILFV